ncbi:putative DNA-binding domain-containing protein [Pseudohongiella nitratireducens]|uniref:HvfC/BufC family peptide modification chaperone n=1 Tax=Pseudohongiella nitratireducens TaxID=1768907 RepID=UPI0030EF1673|tara:strand:- start:2717 stop:3547 length:831 start_codon:yes stop_codon:yes gene_type:complete
MTWQEEQAAFWHWIVDTPGSAAPTEAEKLMAPHQQLSVNDALGIYQNAYRGRLLQAASELYPVTYYTLGDAAHQQLWLGYLEKHPPKPGPMSQLGAYLLTYCRQHDPYRGLPALLELIALETRLVELFENPDLPHYSREQLQNNPAEDWAKLSWTDTGDWTLMEVDFDLETYWLKIQDYRKQPGAKPGGADFPVPAFTDQHPRHLLIRRQNHKMHFQQVSPTFAGFISLLKEGKNFAELCEYLSQHDSETDVPAKSLNYLLQAIDLELLHQQTIRA